MRLGSDGSCAETAGICPNQLNCAYSSSDTEQLAHVLFLLNAAAAAPDFVCPSDPTVCEPLL